MSTYLLCDLTLLLGSVRNVSIADQTYVPFGNKMLSIGDMLMQSEDSGYPQHASLQAVLAAVIARATPVIFGERSEFVSCVRTPQDI